VNELGQDEFRFAPYLGDLVVGCFELALDLFVGDFGVADRFGEQGDGGGDGAVEGGRLVHERLPRRGALDIATQRLYRFQHLVCTALGCRFECQPIDNVRHATKRFILISGPGIYIYAYTRKGTWQRLAGDADSV